jgi:hypothetical protein
MKGQTLLDEQLSIVLSSTMHFTLTHLKNRLVLAAPDNANFVQANIKHQRESPLKVSVANRACGPQQHSHLACRAMVPTLIDRTASHYTKTENRALHNPSWGCLLFRQHTSSAGGKLTHISISA